MTFAELKHKIIEEGIASVKKNETGSHREGGLEGFEMCKTLDTMSDFEKVLEERWREEQQLTFEARTKMAVDKYWKYRYVTLQIECCCEILKVAFKYPVISARAGLRYAELVGVGA